MEKKFLYVASHQMFTVSLAVCIYAYDYVLAIHQMQNETTYLMLAFFSLLGSIASLAAFTVAESHEIIKQKTKKGLDKAYIEPVLLCAALLLYLLFHLLLKMDIRLFTLSGLIISVAVLAYFIDMVLLLSYSTVMHRVLRKQLLTDSFCYSFWQLLWNYEKGIGLHEMFRKSEEQVKLKEVLKQIAAGELETTLDAADFHGQEKEIAGLINQIQSGLKEALERQIKDEKMKTDLITNVSHDIKTPLTSIVNYTELLKREALESEAARRYVRIISEKAQRLKTLTEDLVEVSRISSGNIKLEMQTIDFLELLYQTGGEFNEKFEQQNLTIITKLPAQPIYIQADGRQLYRAIENLYSNAAKYSLENTNVYVELMAEDVTAVFRIKNISKYNIEIASGDYMDLTERFVRGEISRTTEGSGLGLSIVKTLTHLMGGSFAIRVDREMFMAQIKFPLIKNSR